MPHLTRVPLSHLRKDRHLWPRERLAPDQVRNLEDVYRHPSADTVPPILIAPADDEGKNLLIDGWHRVEAAERAGLRDLPAEIRRVSSDEEAYELAVRLSSRGSQPMTVAEKRAAVDRLLAADPERSDRAIAEIAGVSHPTVAQRRALLGKPRKEREAGEKVSRPWRQAQLLLQAAQRLAEACATEAAAEDETAVQELIAAALARGVRRTFGEEAGEWLRRLEAWVHQAGAGFVTEPAPDGAGRYAMETLPLLAPPEWVPRGEGAQAVEASLLVAQEGGGGRAG